MNLLKEITKKLIKEPKVLSLDPYQKLKSMTRYEPCFVDFKNIKLHIPDGPSFYYTQIAIFDSEIYLFTSESKKPVILDCGANCGLSVLYFKQLYPESIITAVEPDPFISTFLEKNIKIAELKNVNIVKKAVSNFAGVIPFFSEGADAGRIVTDQKDSKKMVQVETILLDDLIGGKIDFLKIDIEGAEVDALLCSHKLDQVERMFVEYHSFLGREQELHQLLKKIAEAGFRYYITTPFCPPKPFHQITNYLGMDLQLNISCIRMK